MNRPAHHRMFRIALFTVLTVLLVEAILRLTAPWLPPPMLWYNQIVQLKADDMESQKNRDQRAQLVFVGDSATAAAFDPERFSRHLSCNVTAYNAAIPGATPRVLKRWVPEVVLPALRPQWVVIGLTSRSFNEASTDSAYDAYQTAPAARFDLRAQWTRNAARFSYLVRYRSVLQNPVYWKSALTRLLPGLEAEEPWAKPHRRGFRLQPEPRAFPPYGLKGYAHAKTTILRDFVVSTRELNALETLVRMLRTTDRRVALVNVPVSEDYPSLHPRGSEDYRRYREALRDFAARHRVSWFDLSSGMNSTYFFLDPIHVNPVGADRATDLLAEQLDLEICSSL